MAATGPAWTVTAEVGPATDAPPAAPTDSSLGTRRDWAKASGEVRTTVKWLITALAAVGAMLFAKGVVTTPGLSWSENRGQLVWALLCGTLALLGIGALITMAVRLLRPAMYTLGDLPPGFRTRVDANPSEFLPTGVTSIADFDRRYRRAQRAVFMSEQILAQLTRAATNARAAADSAADTDPGKPALLAAAIEAESARDTATDGRSVIVHNWAVHRQSKDSLLERAEYHTQISGISRAWLAALVLSGIAAALGGIGYLLALATPADDASPAEAVAAPVVGELVMAETEAARRLWATLDLAQCQADPAVAKVAVLIASGAGSATDPYQVTTLPRGSCRGMTFPVLAELATVVRPTPVTITYTPAPSPSPSRLSPSPAPSFSR
ncbi:hypothetical protein ACOCJ5_14770 [Knoellia sp. CPCC 206450]|uniref:hypothetical protein n=1 Tax=Knoellia tibetensis TaxID=3404798 RepID=UPI003B42F8D0